MCFSLFVNLIFFRLIFWIYFTSVPPAYLISFGFNISDLFTLPVFFLTLITLNFQFYCLVLWLSKADRVCLGLRSSERFKEFFFVGCTIFYRLTFCTLNLVAAEKGFCYCFYESSFYRPMTKPSRLAWDLFSSWGLFSCVGVLILIVLVPFPIPVNLSLPSLEDALSSDILLESFLSCGFESRPLVGYLGEQCLLDRDLLLSGLPLLPALSAATGALLPTICRALNTSPASWAGFRGS